MPLKRCSHEAFEGYVCAKICSKIQGTVSVQTYVAEFLAWPLLRFGSMTRNFGGTENRRAATWEKTVRRVNMNCSEPAQRIKERKAIDIVTARLTPRRIPSWLHCKPSLKDGASIRRWFTPTSEC